MGMTMGKTASGRGRIAQSTLAEINVTPLVDVMLVLLVIFMVASAVETSRIAREAETLRQTVTEEAASSRREEAQVPVDLPRVNAEKMPAAAKAAKPVISLDGGKRVYLDREMLVDCHALSVDACLESFEVALHKQPRAHGLRDANLRADRHLDYGLVLAFMSRLRKVGIEHFGLVTEEVAPAVAPPPPPGRP